MPPTTSDFASAELVVGGQPILYDRPFYFAWINPGDVFNPAIHNREDLVIFAHSISQKEGTAATLELIVQNPNTLPNGPGPGALGFGPYVWCYFSWFNGTTIQCMFQGRLVSVPSNIEGPTIKLTFVAMPLDFLMQKQALAVGMMDLPNWDPVFVSPNKRLDPDSTLEARSKSWNVDRVTLAVSTTDWLNGEDGTINVTTGQGLYKLLKQDLERPPLLSTYCQAKVTWVQQGTGVVQLDPQTITTYSGEGIYDSWPKPLTSIGDGWKVEYSSAFDVYDIARTDMVTLAWDFVNLGNLTGGGVPVHNEGDTLKASWRWTLPWFGQANFQRRIATEFIQYAIINTDPNAYNQPTGICRYTDVWVPEWVINTNLWLRWEAKRDRVEQIRFSLTADLQPVFTDPGGVAANFAQNSELIEINGNVGLEGPYGTFKGNWQPDTAYNIYDYFMVTIAGVSYAYFNTRDNVSWPYFDPRITSTVWQPGVYYGAGESVLAPDNNVYAVLVSHLSVNPFSPDTLDPNLYQIYSLRIDMFSGTPMYQAIPNFRGNWASGVSYVANDLFIGPDSNMYKVIIGHVSTTFNIFNTDPTGRLLYTLLVNPPAIGNLLSRAYFATTRGNQSIQYLILLNRAKLIYRSRVYKVSGGAPYSVAALANISCRMNATINDVRLPGGSVTGKIVSYKLEQQRGGPPLATIDIAACPGNNTTITLNAGSPTYSTGYSEPGYQEVTGAVVAVGGVGDVAYTPPLYAPIDDGLIFPLTVDQAVVSETLQTANAEQLAALLAAIQTAENDKQYSADVSAGMGYQYAQQLTESEAVLIEQAADQWAQVLSSLPTWYELILNPVQNGPFETDYDIVVTVQSLPQQVNLAAP